MKRNTAISFFPPSLALMVVAVLSACASKRNYVVLEIENNPEHVPFERFNYSIISDIGSKNLAVGYEALNSDLGSQTQVVSSVDARKHKNVIVKIFVLDSQGVAKTIADTLVRFDSCQIVYSIKPKEKSHGEAGLLYTNERLAIYRQWNNNCAD